MNIVHSNYLNLNRVNISIYFFSCLYTSDGRGQRHYVFGLSICPIFVYMIFLRNTCKEFLDIWPKHPFGLNDKRLDFSVAEEVERSSAYQKVGGSVKLSLSEILNAVH